MNWKQGAHGWIFVSIGLLSASAVAGTGPALRSPWDVRLVRPTDVGYPHKTPETLPKDIATADYYSDAKHSVIDPVRFAAYNASIKILRDTTRAVESAADAFQATGSRAAAQAVLDILVANARSGGLTGKMSSNQAYYVQNWTLSGLAIAWLKVRTAEPGSPEDRQLVTGWLKQIAGSTMGYFDRGRAKGTGDSRNNHYAWAGLSVLSAGIAANDSALFDWGVAAYDDSISRIQPDGTLPLEMSRGQRALHYHLFAIAPLVTIAEFGAANGLELYGRQNGALSRLIDRAVSGLKDNQFFVAKSGVAQDTPADGKIKSDDVVALVPHLRRYPNPDLAQLMRSVTIKPYGYLGGLPPP